MVYIPFGSGPRNCIGARLAMILMRSGLAYLLRNHYVQICNETNLNAELDANALVPKVKGGINLQIIKDTQMD